MGAGVLLACGIGTGIFYFMDSGEPKEENPVEEQIETAKLVSHLVSMSNNGVISLYSVQNQTELDTFDLKTLSKEKKQVIEKKVEPKKEETKTLGEYELVEITIKAGDSTWAIQEKLTPDVYVGTLLPKLQELNKGKFLHPIYPGETRIFLKEKDGTQVETPQTPQTITEEKIVRIPDDQPFLYFKDVENKTLYAYNDFDKAVYEVKIKDGKLSANVLIQNDKFHDSSKLIVKNNRVWLASKDKTSVQMVSVDNPLEITPIEVKAFTDWQVIDDTLFYTYDKMIASYNVKTEQTNEALLGDQTKELVVYQDKLLALNTFGKNTDNALLYQINPSDLKVEDLVELKSEKAELISNGNEEEVYIGRMEKTKGLDGEEKFNPAIVGINMDKFTVKSLDWKIPYVTTSMSYSEYVYALKDGIVEVYREGKEEPEKTIQVKGSDISLIP